MQPKIKVDSNADIRREAISENHHCVVVDDFLCDPHELIDFAADHAREFSRAKSYYPGIFLRVSDDAMTDIYRFIRFRMTKQFPFLRSSLRLSSFLSMVTLLPNELSAVQRICHTDAELEPGRVPYAALLYLFDDERLGGTSFFRYKKKYQLLKNVEALDSEDPEKARNYLLDNFPTFREPARYMTESNEIAKLVYTIPPRFNRLLFYSGRIPHNAAISAPDLLSNDVRTGRLTLNVFADVLPK